jgi:hypothetical protein
VNPALRHQNFAFLIVFLVLLLEEEGVLLVAGTLLRSDGTQRGDAGVAL